MKPLLFIKTQFNWYKSDGYNGQLISMAIVDKFNEFYEVIKIEDNIIIAPWVNEYVIPFLGPSVSYEEFQKRLEIFLSKKFFPEGFTLISDSPDNIRYFLESLLKRPGYMMDIASFDLKVEFDINSSSSKIPNNALEDAKALRESYVDFYLNSL